MSTPRPYYNLDEICLNDSEGQLCWSTKHDLPQVAGGRRSAAVMVVLDVDGEPLDVVYGDLDQQSDRETVERAINALTRLLAAFEDLYPEGMAPVGRCWEYGEWGQCQRDVHGPEVEHKFPTEDHAMAVLRVRRQKSA